MCPHDHIELKEKKYRGVTVFECEKCHGKWFAQDDLRLAKDATDEDLRWLDFELFEEKSGKFKTKDGAPHQSSAGSACPVCKNPMQSKEYSESKVVIDVCTDNHGVWLDNKEFQKIIKYLETVLVTKPSSEYAKDVTEELKEIIGGPEGTASELKDFLAVTRLYEMRLTAEHPWLSSLLSTYYAVTPFK